MANVLKPQKGAQERFLSTSADIAIYGGAAGGGKTYALLLELLRNIDNKGFNAVVFRRNSSQIFNSGGLWDNAISMYTPLGGIGVKTPHPMIKFPSGAYIRFAHLQYEKDKNAWQGGQICLLCCEVSTPVLMEDGSYKKISDIIVGDKVKTLQGVQTVTKVGATERKECVRAILEDGMEQVQSVNHKVLTSQGWKSYEDGKHFVAFTYDGDIKATYRHPYTNKIMVSDVGVKVQRLTLEPIGERLVRDITVETDNHYITECGLVNKNCFDEVTHFCLTPDTEVLTKDGWKLIGEVNVGDKVPSLSKNGKIETANVVDMPRFAYQGKLVNVYQKRGISARMTPNHKVPVWSQADGEDVYRMVDAAHMLKRMCAVIRNGEWADGVEVEYKYFDLPTNRGCGRNANAVAKVKMDDWLEFLGWYLSEGSAFCCSKLYGGSSPRINIRQTKRNHKLDALMSRLPWKNKQDSSLGYNIRSRQLYDVLKPMGNLYEKRIPRYVFGLTKRQMQIFFDAFVEGDGHVSESEGIQIRLANEGLIDDLSEMALYLGYSATKRAYKVKNKFNAYCLCISKKDKTWVRPENVIEEDYNGEVHCLTLDKNHTFFIRHKGRTHWTGNSSAQFWYMLSRNRSVCGVKPYVRATCNPDADSWLANFMQWWWDPETGYPIPERSGVIRYFARYDDKTYWGDTREELLAEHPQLQAEMVKSFTFISAKLTDNKILMENDPGYLGNLLSQNEVEKERLLYGNWKIKPAVGMYFKRIHFQIVDVIPGQVVSWVRAWDFAATEPSERNPNPDATAGVLMGMLSDGRYIVADVKHHKLGAGEVRRLVMNTAVLDRLKYKYVEINIPQDPGQAGKEQAASYVTMLAGFTVNVVKPTGSKETRANPFASQVQVGNVLLLKGEWNEAYLSELEGFPEAVHDDQVDASSDAFNALQNTKSWAGLIS